MKESVTKAPIILGIDPGTRITGYGVIQTCGQDYQVLDYGCIKPPSSMKLTDRYHIIFNGIETIIATHQPQALIVETQFVQKNVQSAIKLGMARGMAILAAKRQGIPVFEYTPMKAKLAVVGNGRASKAQVQSMVQLLLKLPTLPTPEDAADALALAICHAHSARFYDILAMEI